MLTFGSLFSGIGGIDLGLERAGMTCVWQSEIEPYACRVLAKHWPAIPNLGDIREIDWTTVPRTDVVAGGYPCQPFSLAGRRAGADDPRHLWPMFADCIRMVRPRYAILENVAGHLTLGFGDVQADLATLGYDTEWDCIPAAAVGAPHRRDRVFVIATRRDSMDTNSQSKPRLTKHGSASAWPSPMADTDNTCTGVVTESRRWPIVGNSSKNVADTDKQGSQRRFSTQNSERQSADRHARQGSRWQVEPGICRVANGIPHRMDRLRGLGNAVVPQVAEHIGRIIMSMEET